MVELVHGQFRQGHKILVPEPRFTSAEDIVNHGVVFMSPEAEELLADIEAKYLRLQQTAEGEIFLVPDLFAGEPPSTLGLLTQSLPDLGGKMINPWIAVGLALQYAQAGWDESHRATRIIVIHDWVARRHFLVTMEGDCEGAGDPHIALGVMNRESILKVNTGILVARS